MASPKSKKIIAKIAFNRIQNELYQLIEEQDGQSCQKTRTEVRLKLSTLNSAMESLVHACDELGEHYSDWHEVDKMAALTVEMEAIDNEFLETAQAVNDWLMSDASIKSASVNERLKQEIALQEKKMDKLTQEWEATLSQVIKDFNSNISVRVGEQNQPRKGPQKQYSEMNARSGVLSRASAATASPGWPVSPIDHTPHGATSSNVRQSTPFVNLPPPAVIRPTAPEFVPQAGRINTSDMSSQQLLVRSPKLFESQQLQQQPATTWQLPQQPKLNPPSRQEYLQRPAPPGAYGLVRDNAMSSTTGHHQSPTANDTLLSFDSSRLLTRVPIPKFTGDKKNYESWKSAFVSCVDNTAATPVYKLLRLRDSLQGEALKVIESLGHSAAAYEVAKERLERKYGGKRRQIVIRLEELDKFKQVRENNAKDLEAFAELLDVLTVNLCDVGQETELGGGALYISVQRKLSETLLSRYNRWVFENHLNENVKTLRTFVNQESEFLTNASETVKGVHRESLRRDQTGRTFAIQQAQSPSPARQKPWSRKCHVCDASHGLWACQVFRTMNTGERWEKAKELKVCFRCLSDSHRGDKCPRSRVCGIDGCKYNHHRLLHEHNSKSSEKQDSVNISTPALHDHPNIPKEGESRERAHTTMLASDDKDHMDFIALRTVAVFLKCGSRSVKVNALLDDASTRSYINSDVAAELGLEGKPQQLTVHVLNNNQATLESSTVDFVVESMDGNIIRHMSAHTTNRVTGNMHVINWNKHKQQWSHLKKIQFPHIGPRPIVDILIGVDQADLHCSLRDIRGEPGEPIARLTPLGWTCIGSPYMEAQNQTNFTFFQQNTDDLNQLMKRFWEIEELPSQPSLLVKPEEKTATNIVSKSLTYKNGHYCVGIPWKPDRPKLPDNYDMAVRRLENTEKRLLRSPEVASVYADTLIRYQEKGYIRKLSSEEANPSGWFLPHFPVLRPDKSTTKTRLVFDASARYQGISLNDVIYQGPKLQNDLFAILIRFRREPIALMCDISEMYLQIELTSEDRPYHRFLWRGLNTNRQPDVYEFNRVVFGVNSSPFQAQFVAQHHAKQHQALYPRAAETMLKSTYMDDSMDSVADVSACIDLYKQLSQLWASAGMHARKWLSNSPEVLKCIPAGDCALSVDLDKETLPTVKTLGILWEPKDDKFTFSVNPPGEDYIVTKRSFLKKIATLFDPLGFLMPFTTRAKMLMQEMWATGCDWDDPINKTLALKAKQWFSELSELKGIKVMRCLRQNREISNMTLHVFGDASQDAYGAVAYIRCEYVNEPITCHIVAAKSRVAPLNSVSIPRMELMAAVVGLRLAKVIGHALDLTPANWTLWSDSMDVLYWIRGRSRSFKPFVANRVGEIQSSTNPTQWRYVPTASNPADFVSRGITVAKLTTENMWWNGPTFLCASPQEWPLNKIESKLTRDHELRKQCQTSSANATFATTVDLPIENRLDPNHFSSWVKLTRVCATVMRFVDNCRLPLSLRSSGAIKPEEIVDAETHYVKLAQQEKFKEDIRAIQADKPLPKKSKLLPLKPIFDDDGILRCDGRLQYTDSLPWESRNPVILPRGHWVTTLIVKETHERCQHGGTNQVLSMISTRYWIISAREEIRQWERKCMWCRRRKAIPASQVMAPLPELRTRLSLRAFSQSAVDFAGPFTTKQGRGKCRQKRYLCLFTCLATRAIHLELAYNMTTDAFLNAFYRMTSRRGLPQDMFSDNGTNLVGGNNELQELLSCLDNNKIQNSTANQGVRWHFNPPAAPHFGGVHEVMIKAAKKAIYSILEAADITDEELLSAIVGAEGLINSRPLTYQSANAMDIVPLTPNHFLHGQVGGEFAPESVDVTDFSPRKRWRRVQELVRHFWNRWLREWLPGLNTRKKWNLKSRNFQVGDIVLVLSPDTPRGKWPLGRIQEVYPGRDGNVRTVDVKVGNTVMRRPIVKLCPLERCQMD